MDFRTITLAMIALAASGCAGLTEGPPGALNEPRIERLSEELFMVPVARDSRGCVLYRVQSPYRRFDRAIYWRVDRGHFTTDRDAVRCA